LAAVGLLGDGIRAERRRYRQGDEQRAGHQRHPRASESLHDRNGTSILATPRGSAGAMAELGAIHARTMTHRACQSKRRVWEVPSVTDGGTLVTGTPG